MKKKILFLGLIMIMALTSCGIKNTEPTAVDTNMAEALTDKEMESLNKYLDEYNTSLEGKVKATANKDERTVNIEASASVTVEDPELLRETTTDLSKLISENVAKKIVVNYYYEGESESILLVVKDGKITEDNLDQYLEENPEKNGNSDEMNAQEKTIINTFIEEANSAAGETLKVEFDETSKTMFIILTEGTTINDSAAIKDAAQKTSTNFKSIIGDGYTVSVVYSNKKDTPEVSYKDGEVVVDNLK